MLNWMQRAIRMRRENPEIGRGDWTVIDAKEPSVFAYRCDWEGGTVVAVHNLASRPCTVSIDIEHSLPGPVIEIFGDSEKAGAGDEPTHIELAGYGYRWFRCGRVRL